ncbi:retrotransposon protein, putative, ty1-copia subclass [Tanacetum coccineum]|uniref:Retrotransposon protein, putative, ty1-copia subclass n=1 Tax=Tanacetum coccineum TaxID=301880 RepID=A0ABQ4YRP2_9ASTR
MGGLVYPMPLVLGVNLILTSLLKDYDPFMQNYNMHDMGKTIPELHAMLKLVEKGIPKKAPAVLAIRQAIKAIWSFDLILPGGMKRIAKLQHDGLLESTDDESFDVCVSCISRKMARKPFSHASERADDLLVLIHSDSAARILNMVPTKKVTKTLYEIWHGKVLNFSYLKVFKSNIISQEVSGSILDFDEVQRQDAQPSANTSEHQPEAERDDVDPQIDVNPVCRSARIPRAPEQYGFYVNAEEHELGYHGEPPNYQAALSNPESEKWLEAMNTEMQSMKDNQVWILVDLPPDYKTVGSKWIFKKKTDMDGNIHTYKARLLAKGFTQTYGVDYEETFSLVADIKAIRILIAIAAYYDYAIWQMDVKTAFLNSLLNKDVYMVQQEGSWNKRFDKEIKMYGFWIRNIQEKEQKRKPNSKTNQHGRKGHKEIR